MITAKIIADSIITEGVYSGTRVTTFELDYPRYIHAELMTHRVFSRNAASSRAIPIDTLIAQVETNTVMPIWTANQSGMQGKVITDGMQIHQLNAIWIEGAMQAKLLARKLASKGAHKQNVNRVLEPYQHIKTIVTATDYDNWFNLRAHPDAQPEIQALAKEMLVARVQSTPYELCMGEWHLPYTEGMTYDLEDLKLISASCCAQVSYLKSDDTLEKAKLVYERLVGSKPLHASPFEHQCTPSDGSKLQKGNLRGFTQLRELIES